MSRIMIPWLDGRNFKGLNIVRYQLHSQERVCIVAC